MIKILLVAADEWRFWRRSRLAMLALGLLLVLVAASATLTALRMASEAEARAQLQSEAEETYRSQPDRHPHRMVHYGHYVFRTPPPLAMIDPGVDPVTGQSIFLEGHRQNAAMFADASAGATTAQLADMSPATVLSLFAPLLLIAMGYSVMTREREAGTLGPLLAQGVSPLTLMAGKGLALLSVAGLALLPLLITAAAAVSKGETLSTAAAFASSYGLYLLVWSALVVVISSMSTRRAGALTILVVIWILLTLIIPRLAANVAASAAPAQGKIEADYAVLSELRSMGDGHNAADPAFEQLKANLLQQYGVASVEELPVNFRGIVAEASEADLTAVLNRFAEERMATEIRQAGVFRLFGWVSPSLALREASMITAGTGLEAHHKFLRDAENLRFDFVQGLNRAHAEQLTYADDSNRSGDPEAERRTRVSSDNWQMLEDFNYVPPSSDVRVSSALEPLGKLGAWFALLFGVVLFSARGLKP
jgi:ABC-2 type transport system permease protein